MAIFERKKKVAPELTPYLNFRFCVFDDDDSEMVMWMKQFGGKNNEK